jgi:hypothetical protein
MSVLLGQPLIPELTLGIYAATKSCVLRCRNRCTRNRQRQPLISGDARTGLVKSWRGAFNMTHGATMGAHASNAARSDDLS